MNTLETTYATPSRGGTSRVSEEIVPEGLRKLGRAAVWAVAGGQFVDLIWGDGDDPTANDDRPATHDRRPVEVSRERLSEAELADLIGRAERERSGRMSSFSR